VGIEKLLAAGASIKGAARKFNIARVEAGAEGTDTRFIVTNLEAGRAKHLYERRAQNPAQNSPAVERPRSAIFALGASMRSATGL
jgi:hypothetical protein